MYSILSFVCKQVAIKQHLLARFSKVIPENHAFLLYVNNGEDNNTSISAEQI